MESPAKGGICGSFIKARYLMAILSSTGMGIIYGLKVGLHVAIVSMVNHTAINQKNEAGFIHNTTTQICFFNDSLTPSNTPKQDGPFLWSNTIQGYLLSSYFWGYMVAQLPGGRLAELFSAKWVLFFAVAINVIATLLTPIFSKLHYGALLFLRILQGIGGGVTFPANHVLLAHWAPPLERSVMSNLVYAGTALGTVIFMLVSGLIAGAINWEAVFYIEGVVSALWLIFWAWLVSDTPQKQTLISQEERDYIVGSLRGQTGAEHPPPIPWKKVFTSLPFLAIFVAHTTNNWGWYMLLIELPQYMKNVLQFSISQNGILTAMPFFIMWLYSLILSKILDTLRKNGKISTGMARKIATGSTTIPPMICFIILTIKICDRTLAVVIMTIAITTIGGMFSGLLSNHIDIAPNFAGTLIAITNTFATIPGIVVPVVVGKLTDADPTYQAWRIVFFITIALYILQFIVYNLWASGEVQEWNNVQNVATENQPLRNNEKSRT